MLPSSKNMPAFQRPFRGSLFLEEGGCPMNVRQFGKIKHNGFVNLVKD